MVPKQAVIFCGGRGERLRPLTDTCPKPLVPVAGRPFLEYLVEQLWGGGIESVLLLTGYLGGQIKAHFGDRVTYHHGPDEWETGRRLAEAAHLLDARFMLLYADNFAPVSLPWLSQFHEDVKCPLTITISAKPTGNVRTTGAKVESYDARNFPFVDIGYMIAERDSLLPNYKSFSETIRRMTALKRVAAFNPGCFYHSISDVERLRLTEEYVRPKKILLIDRDGVINRKAPRGEYIWLRKDFEYIEGNVKGMEELTKHGFEFIVLTNQAGIGRGVVPKEGVDELHKQMKTDLRGRGITIRDVLVCPHHWKDLCNCRKPMPGMFFAAAKKHNIRLDRAVYIGDDERDGIAASRAGCRFLMMNSYKQLIDTYHTILESYP